MIQLVRPARPDDADALHHLEVQARHALVEQRGGSALLAERPATSDWIAAIDDHTRWIGVAELDGFVVGYIELLLHADTADVHQIYVEPPAREIGFGDDLLDAARHEAQRHGCSVLEGTALPGDRETKNLFERAGMTARKIIVSTRLSP